MAMVGALAKKGVCLTEGAAVGPGWPAAGGHSPPPPAGPPAPPSQQKASLLETLPSGGFGPSSCWGHCRAMR